MRDIGLA